MNELKKRGIGQRVAVAIFGVFATVALLLSLYNTFKPMKTEAAMTQTQAGVNDIISDVLKDKNLDDSQKAMLIEVFRNFSADYVVSMDDAKLVIKALLDSGLLTDEQTDLLNNLLVLIDSGVITDVGLVKDVIANILLGLKNYIVGEKSATYNRIETLIDEINGDASLTADQKTQFVGILYNLLDDEISLKNLDDMSSCTTLIQNLLDNEMITDPVTENTLRILLDDLSAGKNIDISIVREAIKFAITQMMGDVTYSDEQKTYLSEILAQYTNAYDKDVNFDDIKDAILFLNKLLTSELVGDAHIMRDGTDIINRYMNGENISVEDVVDIINRALDDIRCTLLKEKISILTGTPLPDKEDAEEYYRRLIARYTSSQFNYLTVLATSNQSDIIALREEIDQNMILTDEQREKILKMLEEYQLMGGEALNTTADDLRRAIEENTTMDSRTKASLITMINNLDSDNAMSIDELKKKLSEQIASLSATDVQIKGDLEEALNRLDETDRKNFRDLKHKLEDLQSDTGDNFDKTSQTIAALKKEMQTNDSALSDKISALDSKTARQIAELADSTDAHFEEFETTVNNHFTTLETDVDNRFNTLESETNEKINLLRSDMNTNIALLQADIAEVEQSVVDTNTNMQEMNTNLIARDEDMKSALDVSMAASFTNVTNYLSDLVNTTESNIQLMYSTFKTAHNSVVNNLGQQTTYTLTTDANGDPVLTFTPYGEGFTEVTGDLAITETDDPEDIYTAPEYSQQ